MISRPVTIARSGPRYLIDPPFFPVICRGVRQRRIGLICPSQVLEARLREDKDATPWSASL